MTRPGMAKRIKDRKTKKRNVQLLALRLLQQKLEWLPVATKAMPMRYVLLDKIEWPRGKDLSRILHDNLDGEFSPADLARYIDELCESL